MFRYAVAVLLLAVVGTLHAQPAKEAIKKIEAKIEPAEAKPGQTVTLKLTVTLAEGYHTYPVMQFAPEAKFQTNKITFPTDASIIFVGDTVDPVSPATKKEEDYEMLYYPGGGTWSRKAVIAPNAKAGETTTKVKLKLLVCDKDNCFPPKTIDVEASVKVLDTPAVEVEKAYKADVEKALKK